MVGKNEILLARAISSITAILSKSMHAHKHVARLVSVRKIEDFH